MFRRIGIGARKRRERPAGYFRHDLTDDEMADMSREIDAIVASCPEIADRWNLYKESADYDIKMPYTSATFLAWHVLDGALASKTRDAFFIAVEHKLATGSPELRNLLVSGLLEDLQNRLLHEGASLEEWEPRFGMRGRRAWRALILLWKGKLKGEEYNRLVALGFDEEPTPP